MPINKFHKNYTLNEAAYQLKLPLEMEILIPANDCVRLASQLVEGMNLTDLYDTYERVKGNQASPRQMLKIMLYAYLDGCYSSREIESACKRDVNYMYLLEGKPAPDHATIARFRTLHFAPCAARIMAYFSNYLQDIGEISGKQIFIDGTKIEACAGRYTFVWKKAVTKNMEKLLVKIAALIENCVNAYGLRPIWHGEVKEKHISKVLKSLYKIKEEEGIEFVSGSGKRKTQLQRDIQQLEEYSDKLKEYKHQIAICGNRNSYSKTDNDATFMRMKEDHMLNGQLKPAYNLQHGVDAEYITWLTISPNPTDTKTLIPFIEDMHRNLSFRYTTIVADAGYESEENYSYLEENNLRGFIKPTNYERSKKRNYKNDISLAENMEYDSESDCYICKAGNIIEYAGESTKHHKSGYSSKVTQYECKACKDCPLKSECIKGNNWKIPEEERFKKLTVPKVFVRQRKECLERITSEEGILLRMNRSIQVEGSFGILKEDRKFRRFLCRGKENVYAECVLLALSHNIEKLHRKIQNDRTGTHLFPLKAS